MLRGILYWTGLVLSVYLLMTLTEFRAYFRPEFKIALVGIFMAVSVFSALTWIIRPLLSYLKLGKRISHEQAASIIGAHFPDVRDKLVNILQLRSSASSAYSRDLIEASIDQKSSEIKLVTFTRAINLGHNKRYLRYALPPALILLVIFLGSPDILRDSTRRLANPARHYEREAPFRFEVSCPESVIQYEDAEILVRIDGGVLPSEVFVNKEGKLYKMAARQKDLFAYSFRNVEAGFRFTAEAEGFSSMPCRVGIIPKPTLMDAQVDIRYPAYTGLQPEVLRSVGVITVPEGSRATWKFNTRHTTALSVRMDGAMQPALSDANGFFEYGARLLNDQELAFYLSSDELEKADSVLYNIDVIPDRYPAVGAEKISDSVNTSFMYFIGEYSDDYGISDLRFNFRLNRYDQDAEDSIGSEKLQFERNASLGRFSHYTNADLFSLEPGDQLEFYFEVADNDAVNGAKTSKSRVFTYKKPTAEEFGDMEAENNEAIKDELEEAIEKVESFAKEVEKLKEDVLEKKSLSWEEKKQLEDLLEKHDQLNEALEQMQQTFEENLDNQKEFKEVDEEILEKQEKIQELMEEVLTDEMKEMMDQIRQMMEELDMDELFENLEDFEMTNEELELQLDRMLELFKKLEFEQKMQDVINELEDLAEQQLDLSEQSKEDNADSEEILDKQEKLNEQFDELKEDFSELQEMNKEQQSPADLNDMDQQSEEISEEMQEGTEQLQQSEPGKASPSQKNAGEKMQQMAKQMASQMMTMEMMQAMEDLDNLRQLLENLVKLSFDQEQLFEEVKQTQTEQPKFRELVQHQYKLKDDAAMIEDSLVALSKRVFQLESFITEELHKMNREIGQSIDNMEERRKGPAVGNQQYVMTSANNLALMLSETMEQMQQAMAQSMPGKQQCQKPGGKGQLPGLQQLQQQLNEDMQQMMDGLKKGKQPGGPQMSKEFARMAAQQAALREALRKMKENMSQGQKEGGNIDELMEQMDLTETDLLNKRLTEETLKRQEEIITNLLEMEDAEREQDKEEKRESKTADQVTRKLPPEIEEYLRERQSTVEVFQAVPPTLSPFYKKLVEKYFKGVN
jgi:hypothetical protein